MTRKLKVYNNATIKLVNQAHGFNVPNFGPFSLVEAILLLREAFKYKLTYKKVFGFTIKDNNAPLSTDYCKIVLCYIFDRFGAGDVWEIKETPIHWWLEYKQTGEIFDVTYDQFSEAFPYHLKSTVPPVFGIDEYFTNILRARAMILGKSAGME